MLKYSFIVPVYNAGAYLIPCVESLLAQTVRDFEILLIDDGSTDGSGALCDTLAQQHACIRTFHKENGGAASARNYGIDRAMGEKLLFIDGDDTIEPDTLGRIEAADECDLVIFGMAFDYYEGGAAPVRTEHLSIRHQGQKDRDFFRAQFRELFDDNALSSACNKVFSARVLRETGLRFRENMTLYEDLDLVLRYFGRVDRFAFIDSALYHYRINAANFGHKRVHNLAKLRENLGALAGTVLAMEPQPQGAVELMANLYLQLLLRHLLVTNYRKGELPPVYDYCEDENLCRCLESGAELGQQEQMLLELISRREGGKLLGWLRKKRAVSALRKTAKGILKALGLRR